MSIVRYVFWRDQNGAANGSFDKFAPLQLLRDIGTWAKVKDGLISWEHFGVLEVDLFIHSSAIVVNDGDELNEEDSANIMREATNQEILRLGGGKPIQPEPLLLAADKIASQFFRTVPTKYLLSTSISAKALPAKTIALRDCKIRLVSPQHIFKRNGKWRKGPSPRPRIVLPSYVEHLIAVDRMPELPKKYKGLLVYTQGRSIHEAVSKAFYSLNVFRGLWNLYATFQERSLPFSSGPKRSSLGAVHTGFLHTLHNLDGSPAVDNQYWFDADYPWEKELFDPRKEKAEKINSLWRKANRYLLQHPFRNDMDKLLIRYTTALDHSNTSVTALYLWSILESIMKTIRHEEVIEKTSWIYSDTAATKEILHNLRFRRNQFVHSSRASDAQDTTAQMLKTYVDAHLHRLIFNPFKCKTLAEYGEFLSQPFELDALKKRLQLTNRVIKIVSGPKKPKKSPTS